MEEAGENDDQESLTIPANHLRAIMMEPEEANRTVQVLTQSGFSWDEISVLTGGERSAVERECGEKGFLAKIVTSETDAGKRDTEYTKQYRRAALNGRTIIAVEANTNQARDKAKHILKAGGARFITFFGQFTAEILET